MKEKGDRRTGMKRDKRGQKQNIIISILVSLTEEEEKRRREKERNKARRETERK